MPRNLFGARGREKGLVGDGVARARCGRVSRERIDQAGLRAEEVGLGLPVTAVRGEGEVGGAEDDGCAAGLFWGLIVSWCLEG